MHPVMLPVTQIHGRGWLWPRIGSTHYPAGVDDRDLNDDLAQHAGGVGDGIEVRGVLAGPDATTLGDQLRQFQDVEVHLDLRLCYKSNLPL